jgi:integrase
MSKRRGAKPDFVLHPETNESIEGLYANKDKRGKIRYYYYLDKNGKQKTCTSDLREAIKRFNAFKEEKKYPDLIEIPEEAQEVPIGRYGLYFKDGYVNKTWVIQTFQDILNSDRKLVVDVTGNPKYWDFENTPSRPQSLTCQEVIDEYLAIKRKKTLNDDYRYRMIRHWNAFKRAVGKNCIRDITFQDVKRYRVMVVTEAEKKEKAGEIKRLDLYINERFSAIHDILVKIREYQEYKRDTDNLLDHTGQLRRLTKDEVRPKAINPEQWKILYAHSKNNLFIRCSLLLGLNCAMTWGDIIDLTPDQFNFQKNTYIGTRSKNNIQNCAMLFPETSSNLKEYIISHPTSNGSIFYYKDVNRTTMIDDIVTMFREWKLSLPKSEFKKVETITHKHLRKSVRTTAFKAKCHIEYIKLVMGRKLEGSEEHYTEKDATMTTEVIKAVHDHYFQKK